MVKLVSDEFLTNDKKIVENEQYGSKTIDNYSKIPQIRQAQFLFDNFSTIMGRTFDPLERGFHGASIDKMEAAEARLSTSPMQVLTTLDPKGDIPRFDRFSYKDVQDKSGKIIREPILKASKKYKDGENGEVITEENDSSVWNYVQKSDSRDTTHYKHDLTQSLKDFQFYLDKVYTTENDKEKINAFSKVDQTLKHIDDEINQVQLYFDSINADPRRYETGGADIVTRLAAFDSADDLKIMQESQRKIKQILSGALNAENKQDELKNLINKIEKSKKNIVDNFGRATYHQKTVGDGIRVTQAYLRLDTGRRSRPVRDEDRERYARLILARMIKKDVAKTDELNSLYGKEIVEEVKKSEEFKNFKEENARGIFPLPHMGDGKTYGPYGNLDYRPMIRANTLMGLGDSWGNNDIKFIWGSVGGIASVDPGNSQEYNKAVQTMAFKVFGRLKKRISEPDPLKRLNNIDICIKSLSMAMQTYDTMYENVINRAGGLTEGFLTHLREYDTDGLLEKHDIHNRLQHMFDFQEGLGANKQRRDDAEVNEYLVNTYALLGGDRGSEGDNEGTELDTFKKRMRGLGIKALGGDLAHKGRPYYAYIRRFTVPVSRTWKLIDGKKNIEPAVKRTWATTKHIWRNKNRYGLLSVAMMGVGAVAFPAAIIPTALMLGSGALTVGMTGISIAPAVISGIATTGYVAAMAAPYVALGTAGAVGAYAYAFRFKDPKKPENEMPENFQAKWTKIKNAQSLTSEQKAQKSMEQQSQLQPTITSLFPNIITPDNAISSLANDHNTSSQTATAHQGAYPVNGTQTFNTAAPVTTHAVQAVEEQSIYTTDNNTVIAGAAVDAATNGGNSHVSDAYKGFNGAASVDLTNVNTQFTHDVNDDLNNATYDSLNTPEPSQA